MLHRSKIVLYSISYQIIYQSSFLYIVSENDETETFYFKVEIEI